MSKYCVAIETDRGGYSEGYRKQIARLTEDGRFEIRYLRDKNSKPSHQVSADELKGADFYILMGHRLINDATFAGTDRLKWIGRFGAGFENVDISSCNRHGVMFSNAPFALRQPVAELALTFILAHAVKLTFFNSYIREKFFVGKTDHPTICLSGKTLGLLGAGGIAQTLAELVKPFGSKIMAYDPFANKEVLAAKGIELASLEDVLKGADFVSCHLPLTGKTKGMLTADHFRMMKSTAYFVNTGRGEIYQDAVLADAVTKGIIAGAAVDVFEDEPGVENNPLLKCANVIATPHIAGSANNLDGITAVTESLVNSILKMADGELPDAIINPEVLDCDISQVNVSPSYK